MKLREIIKYEKKLYFKDWQEYLKSALLKSNKYLIFKYIKLLRCEEYYQKKQKCQILNLYIVKIQKNWLGRKLGFDIPGGVFDLGLLIWHASSIVINPNAKIGKNAVIVGNLCIGNKGGEKNAPVIGDNCIFGWDSAVIGSIKIGNNCIIGAKSLVNKSCNEDNVIFKGIPAKTFKRN